MPRRARPALVVLMLAATPAAAQERERAAMPAVAPERVGVRTGDHPTYGRIVFDWPREIGYRVEQEAGRLVLRFAAAASFDLPARNRLPRHAQSMEAAGEAVTIAFAPDARPRIFRLGRRVVVDLINPDSVAEAAPVTARAPDRLPAPPASRQAGRRGASRPVARAVVEPSPASIPAPPATVQPAVPAVAPPPQLAVPEPRLEVATAPLTPIQAVPLAPPETTPAAPPVPRQVAVEMQADGVLVPAGAEVGAALLRRGDNWLLVFDTALPLNIEALRGGALARAELADGPEATVLRLPAMALAEPALRRTEAGWLLLEQPAPPSLRSIRAEAEAGPPPRLLLRAGRPGATVSVLDPETGGMLLVGTLREDGEAVLLGRRAPTFDILPTRLGAALLPRADTVTLRALPNGFVAAAGPGATLSLGPEPSNDVEVAAMSRLFDLPDLPLAALTQRERNAMLDVGAAPPLGRGQPRFRHAEALLALGLGAEAQAMITLAMREDPRVAEEPRAHALQGAAALLAGRVAETDGLLHRRLPDSDELALWRGLRAAARGEDGALRIAAALPLLRAWPEPLRSRMMPLAAEALAVGREVQAARRLLSGQEENPAFSLARALLLESSGDTASALEAFEAVAHGRDRRARAVALRRVVELKLASGTLDAAGAAAAMEGVIAAWRGDAMESDARIRLAELRRQAGDARGAFEALREVEATFPSLAPRTRTLQAEALLEALVQEPPISAVTLFDAHQALLPAGPAAERALAALADRLAALDLLDRARRVLGQALARADDDESRGRIGLRLAGLAMAGNDPAGARAALAQTESPRLSDSLRRERLLTEARALAREGAAEQAVERFRAAEPEAAMELAEFLASRQDWTAAAAVLRQHLASALPPPPALLEEPQRRVVARTAAMLALAGDEAGLAALREAEAGRMSDGAFSEAFTLLTAGRMAGTADLPRLRRELELARLLPGRLEALRMPEQITR